MRICVVIPTYNEAAAIAGIIKAVRLQTLPVVVVDDGSVDGTSSLAQASGAVVLRNACNLGKGSSLLRGFRYCLENNFDAVVAMDGDGQHAPGDIPALIKAAAQHGCGMVIGNRMSQTRRMPGVRIATNKVMSWLISVIAKQHIPDSQCGFRLIKTAVLGAINLSSTRYEIESEMITRTASLGWRIVSVPIQTIYNNEQSRINPCVDTLRFARFLVRETLWNICH